MKKGTREGTNGNDVASVLEDSDEVACEVRVGFGEEGDRLSLATCSSCSSDTVNVLSSSRQNCSRFGSARGLTSSMVRGNVWLTTNSTLGISSPRAATSTHP
jgi:hypothetical protein